MKVYIGPYKGWLGPYQLAEKICFWARPTIGEYGEEIKAPIVEKLGDWLAKSDRLCDFLEWVDKRNPRSIYVRIDEYDTWDMDYTLAYIILPMLKKLRQNIHGSPIVDNEDVPPELHKVDSDILHVDENFHKRWEWVLDEMIFAFEAKIDYEFDYKNVLLAGRVKNGFRLFGKYYEALSD